MISSNKFILFLIGVVVGIAIGASVVWWMQNYNFKVWFSFKGKDKQEVIQAENTTSANNPNDEKSKAIINTVKSGIQKKTDGSFNQNDTNYVSTNSTSHNSDSIKGETNNGNSDDFVIAKDELLFTRIIKVEGVNTANDKKEAALDSLLINDKTKKLPSNLVKVEFWRSPINYKGYKYSGNKLVLFGIYVYENASLESRNNKLYLNYTNTFYLIENTDDFEPLMAVKLPKK
ncbi:MAG: hypothetical protein NTZ33_09895 [Bacteroidetes bacterium]|nr:hypothetical protein [Bacteroidota bacterium]